MATIRKQLYLHLDLGGILESELDQLSPGDIIQLSQAISARKQAAALEILGRWADTNWILGRN